MAVETLSGVPSTAPLLLRAALTAGLPRSGTVPDGQWSDRAQDDDPGTPCSEHAF